MNKGDGDLPVNLACFFMILFFISTYTFSIRFEPVDAQVDVLSSKSFFPFFTFDGEPDWVQESAIVVLFIWFVSCSTVVYHVV